MKLLWLTHSRQTKPRKSVRSLAYVSSGEREMGIRRVLFQQAYELLREMDTACQLVSIAETQVMGQQEGTLGRNESA